MLLAVGDLRLEVRAGTAADAPLLLTFIRAMADFERLSATATEESLRAALFGDTPAATTLLAFVEGTPVAYAIYYFTFSSMNGQRGLWLDDLFVDAAWRGRGIGRALMAHLAGIARAHDCARFEWMVLDWNDAAINFYRSLGAAMLGDWLICRLDGTELSGLAAAAPSPAR